MAARLRRLRWPCLLALLPAARGFAADPATFRGDAAHSGIYASAEAPNFASVRWKLRTGEDKGIGNPVGIASSAAAAGVLYVGSTDGHLYALD